MLSNELKKSFLASLWFMFLTFPIMVIRVNTVENIVEWRWANLLLVGLGSFLLSALWRYMIRRKEEGVQKSESGIDRVTLSQRLLKDRRFTMPALIVICSVALAFPFVFSIYQTNIMITAMIYILLGLGLNIVVGVAGLLDLGYAAFYCVGAYSYALLNYHFGLGFWTVLAIGAGLAAMFGIILGFPVLRLRGDYLAIVTLGFGEIIRLIMENWNEFSFGPSGIANIPRPGFFGMEMNIEQATIYIYFLMIGLSLFTIFVVNRLQNSRIGRAWIALREDEVACQAMGIDKRKTKLMAFALGATWAGFAGVVFAAKTTFINPASFTLWESINILCVVVLGGMGSIVGVIVGAFILVLLPEYLRFLSEYRILVYGAVLVVMMVFRPGGIVETTRRTYQYREIEPEGALLSPTE
ncbi:branched-chain amino acid ABC transporter permease [Desulfosarcina widdelii]|uniref:Branched-chain amino acid ABC transporter permease n=1 Tax=Desulfosarcina widdelii TaxID=947919 RepID=A0A5K7ZDF4_9BACT|nr:high-affinity branched-chain amino acid ABC transporter permease LivM [Desulfosarcina widdelii]BBO76484.1 branched-chain amino acid ABC transporter permease [Desulfosarcina widdelii]